MNLNKILKFLNISFLCVLIISLAPNSAFSQSRNIITLNIKDSIAIPYVSIQSENKVQYTDDQGRLEINDSGPYSLYHINFEKLSLAVLDQDTIFLKERQVIIEGITIESERIITEIKQSKKSDIKSFGIIYPNLLIAHTKAYLTGEDNIQLLDAEGKLINELGLDFDFDKMIETCDKQFYLVSKRYAYLISIRNKVLDITSKVTMKDFRINYAFCESDNDIGRVYKYSHVNNLISEFYVIHKHGQLKHLKLIADHDLIKTISKDKQAIIYGAKVSSMEATNRLENAQIRNAQKLSDYLSLVHYNNQYAQNYCRSINNKLYVFNYQLDSLHIYDHELKETSNRYFDRKNPEIIFTNYEQSKIYSLEKSGYNDYNLFQMNDDNSFTKLLNLKSTQISHIAIQSNKIFYLKANNGQYSKYNRMFFENI